MAYFSDVEKAKCVLQFEQNHSATLARRWFRTNYRKEAPARISIYKWHKSFAETGCICAKKNNSGRRPSGETVERVLASFLCSPQKSTRRASRELGDVSHITVWRVLLKRLSFRSHKFQLLQELKPNDRPHRETFLPTCWTASKRKICFWTKLFSMTRLPFTCQGRWIAIIWGSQNPHQVVEHVRDSPKVNVFCAVSRTQVYGPFFFAEATVTGHRVPRYAGALPCSTFGCKQRDLATRWGPAPLSQGYDAVPEPNIPGKMDRSWWPHSLANQIIRSDTHGLLILGIC
jgi:hypothetical protein